MSSFWNLESEKTSHLYSEFFGSVFVACTPQRYWFYDYLYLTETWFHIGSLSGQQDSDVEQTGMAQETMHKRVKSRDHPRHLNQNYHPKKSRHIA